MNDFQFQNTTKVYFGKDQLGHLHGEVLKYGKSVLVVYGGGSIKKIGLYDKVIKELKENNIEVYELAGVEPNPRHTTVNKGAKICKDNHITSSLWYWWWVKQSMLLMPLLGLLTLADTA